MQRRARALAHHGFEGNPRHVDELAQLGAAEQTLRGVGHARGHAFESAWGGGAHTGDRTVVALLSLDLLTTAHQRRQHLVALFEMRHHAAPLVQKRGEREQRGRRAAQRLHRAQGIMPVALGREPGVLIHPNGEREAPALGEMVHDRGGERRALPETHALSQIAAVVRQGHREAQQVELGVAFGGDSIEDGLFPIDLGFDGGLRFFGCSGIAELEQAAQAGGNGAPLFPVVAANAADGADRDAVFRPGARAKGQSQHGPQYIGVARFAPDDAADLGIDIGGHERGDGRVVTGQAEGEVVLQLLLPLEVGVQDVLPVGENAQEAIGRVAVLDETAGFAGGQPRLQKRSRAANLRNESLRADPLSPGVARRFDDRGGQTTSMTRPRETASEGYFTWRDRPRFPASRPSRL